MAEEAAVIEMHALSVLDSRSITDHTSMEMENDHDTDFTSTDVVEKLSTFDPSIISQISSMHSLQLDPAESIERTITTPAIEETLGKNKNLANWEYYAADRTHLSETLTFQYILEWIFGIICGLAYVFCVEYGLTKLLNIHFCTTNDNEDFKNWNLKFLSPMAFYYTLQSILGMVLGFTGYWLFRAPEIVGIKKEYIIKARILAFICALIGGAAMILFTPFAWLTYTLPVATLGFIVFGLVCNRIEGMRRISIWILLILCFNGVNSVMKTFVFEEISPELFGLLYPFYLTILETFVYYLISIFDIPRCCRCLEGKTNCENKATESGLGAIYFWSDRDLYVFVASINVYVESWRIAGVILLQHDLIALITTVIISIISEICTRNNLYYEIIYRLIWRQSAPPLTRVYSIYLGCKLHTEYIPVFLVLMYNLLNFGYTADCFGDRVMENMNIRDCWWIIFVLIGLELSCDIVGHWSNKVFVKIFKIFDKTDEARRVKYVKLKLRDIIFASIHLSFAAVQGFKLDANARGQT